MAEEHPVDVALAAKVCVAVAATALLGWRILHASRSERAAKKDMLAGFAEAIGGPRVEKGLQGLPRLRGELDGHPLAVSLDADSLALRTLPTLWLEARWGREHAATVDLLLEPSGTEYFVRDGGFEARAEPPKGWPASTLTRVSGAEAAPILEGLEHVDPAAFPALKYALVDRRELRVVMRCARADRQTYRVLRSATFGPDAVTPAVVEQTLAALRGIEAALQNGARTSEDEQ